MPRPYEDVNDTAHAQQAAAPFKSDNLRDGQILSLNVG